jgi:Rps23 Pro-64 3,4-dihydroxylase Tpa1-like proline 4-hydroxylase
MVQAADISALVVARLQRDADQLRTEFHRPKSVQTRYVAIDDVLPESLAREIFESFPPVESMRLLDSFRERKYTSKALDRMSELMAAATFAFQTPEMIQVVSEITGFKDMEGDPHLYAGGISTMTQGHFLNPHIDNSHDSERRLYRMLNLLYYVTPDWQTESGGNLELWDDRVRQREEIPSRFNRLVLMETNDRSWHSVNAVNAAGKRCCVSNYYFSPHPPGGKDHFHITFFMARPEQRVRRAVTLVDSSLRSLVRKVVKQGVGRKDIYEGEDAKTK